MKATERTLQLLKAAAKQHPLLLQLIANPPTYEHVTELPNGGNYTTQEGSQA